MPEHTTRWLIHTTPMPPAMRGSFLRTLEAIERLPEYVK